jgi:hypothetical protein
VSSEDFVRTHGSGLCIETDDLYRIRTYEQESRFGNEQILVK